MEWINSGVLRYQHKIGTYDKQLWERSVEKKVLKSIRNVPGKTVKNKPELIDVDLVRGSTFPKAKPQHGLLAVTRLGLTRLVFMPLYYKWWHQQTNTPFTLLLFALYVLQWSTIGIYWFDTDQKLSAEYLSLAHMVTPVLMMVILGLMHAHIVATHELYRPRRKTVTALDSAKIRPTIKLKTPKPKNKPPNLSGLLEQDSGSHDKGIETHSEELSGLRQRKFTTKSLLNRRRSGSVLGGLNNQNTKNDLDGSDEADDESEDVKVRLSRSSLEAKIKNFPSKAGDGIEQEEKDLIGVQKEGSSPRHLKLLKQQDSSDFETLTLEGENGTSHAPINVEVTGSSQPLGSQGNPAEEDYAPCTFEDSGTVQGSFSEVTGQIVTSGTLESSQDTEPVLLSSMSNPPSSKLDRFPSSYGVTFIASEPNSSSEYSPEILEGGDLDELRAAGKVKKCGTFVSGIDHDLLLNGSREPDCGSDQEVPLRKSTARENLVDAAELQAKQQLGGVKKPTSLNIRRKRQFKSLSSGDSEGETLNQPTTESPQVLNSETEWGDIGHTDMTSCGNTTSSNTASETEISDEDADGIEEKDTGTATCSTTGLPHVASVLKNLSSTSDKVSCLIWEGEEVKKIDLTVLDIGWSIIQKVDKIPETCDYLVLGLFFAVVHSAMPIIFRFYHAKDKIVDPRSITQAQLQQAHQLVFGDHWSQMIVVCNGMVQRCFLGFVLFFLLSVAERTFKQRLLYAKHFCYLTSSRRAKKYDMPHFRLNKVRNIKTWFSLRSYLKRRGPQRSVDTIVSVAFIVEVILVSIMCFQLLQDSENFLDHLGNWELILWCMALAIYLLRFMTLGTKINKKYRNFSVLITEQINLYLQMEQKPHKKDELMMANSVLKLAEALLKELEIPFKISGLSANPFLYNITKVILLSAFSAVLTELLGFKLKLYKIKLRA